MKITIGGNTFDGDNIEINGSHVKKGEILSMRANIDGVDVEFERNTYTNHPEYDRGFRNGQQSKQAEIDALKAELAKYQKDGYKLVPVEPSKDKLKEIEEKCFEHPDCFGIDCPLDVIYRAISGEME